MGALDGLLVVSIEQAVAAPMCTLRLADAGARVIKIERPGGETARNYDRAVHGCSAYFAWLNRGKESVVLDLKVEEDFVVFERLLERADVFVHNLAPGAVGRLGFGGDVLRRRFPQLISVGIVGYGAETPVAGMRAYDMLIQAESGLCAVTGTSEEPVKVGISVADIATGVTAGALALEALIARGGTGTGSVHEVAMFDTLADWMAVPLLHHQYAGRTTLRHGLSHASIYPYRPFSCTDGILIVAVQTDQEWARLCRDALRVPTLAEDVRFVSNTLRVQNRAALDEELEPLFHDMSVEQAASRCEAASVAYGRYTPIEDLSAHPALRRMPVTLPDGSIFDGVRPPGRDTSFAAGPVPGLGAHTDRVREEFGEPA